MPRLLHRVYVQPDKSTGSRYQLLCQFKLAKFTFKFYSLAHKSIVKVDFSMPARPSFRQFNSCSSSSNEASTDFVAVQPWCRALAQPKWRRQNHPNERNRECLSLETVSSVAPSSPIGHSACVHHRCRECPNCVGTQNTNWPSIFQTKHVIVFSSRRLDYVCERSVCLCVCVR